jgi:hypothetical protein
MNDKPLNTLGVSQGRNPHSPAGAVGGVNSYIDDDGRPVVILSVGPNDGHSMRHHLHEGETFELGPELWEVTTIDDPGTDFWGVELTRLR